MRSSVTPQEAAFDAAALRGWLTRFADAVRADYERLTALDAAVGDADHGLNLLRGLDAAVLAAQEPTTPGEVLRVAGRLFVSTAGGATGPLWGTLLMRMGKSIGDSAQSIGAAELVAALRAGVDGVRSRGRAKAGDGTMLDALLPALEALENDSTAWPEAVAAAEAGRDSTARIVPRRGRASYLGDRAVGHVDPGSASAVILISTLASCPCVGTSQLPADLLGIPPRA